jgi:hypothetical protein
VSGFERAIVGATTWLMAITGAAYFYMKYLMSGSDPFSAVHHPWQPRALALHVIVGPLAVFALGMIARDHILGRLLDPRQRRGRASGIVILGLAIPMIVSGYLMQVLTDPGIRRILAGGHALIGALYTLLFAGHLFASGSARRGANGNGGSGGAARARRRERRLDRRGQRGIKSLRRLEQRVRQAGSEGMKP